MTTPRTDQDYDEHVANNQWLMQKLDINLHGALAAIALLAISELVISGYSFYRNIPYSLSRGVSFWCLLSFGAAYEYCMLATQEKVSNPLLQSMQNTRIAGLLRRMPIHTFLEWRDYYVGTLLKLKYPCLVRYSYLPYYPARRLVVENFVLTGICCVSGYWSSPYLALVLLHSMLAAMVIDTRSARWNYGMSFASSLVALFALPYVCLPHTATREDPIYSVIYFCILYVSSALTGWIAQQLTGRLLWQQVTNARERNQRVQKILKSWKDAHIIMSYDSHYSNYRIQVSKPNGLLTCSEIMALIPVCLRDSNCPVMNASNDICGVSSDCNCTTQTQCSVFALVQQLEQKHIFWRIIGHGHNIAEVCNEFVRVKSSYPKAVLGFCCVNAFGNIVGELLKKGVDSGVIGENNVNQLLYVKLSDDYPSCPSICCIPREVVNHVSTTVDSDAACAFLEQCTTQQSVQR